MSEPETTPLKHPTGSLPEWRDYARLTCPPVDPVDKEVLALIEKTEGKLTFFHVSGPAVRSMSCALPLIFVFVMLFPVATWTISSCPAEHGHGLYGIFSHWVWPCFLCAFGCLPFFLLMSWWEWKCFKIVIVPYVQWLHPFKDLLGRSVSLQVWLFINFAKSFTAKLDIATSTLFVAKAVKGFTCKESLWATAQRMWEDVINKSMVAWVPFLNQLIVVCVLGWAFQVLQIVVVSLMSYPTKGVRQTDYGFMSEKEGYTTLWTKLESKIRGCSSKVWHADIIRHMALGTRSLLLGELSCDWQMQRVREHLLRRGCTPEEQHRCFEMLFQETRRTAFRLWFMNIFEKAVIIETQTTMYALLKAIEGDDDYICLFALGISFLCLVNCLTVAVGHWLSLRRTHKEVIDQIKSLMQEQEDQVDQEGERCRNIGKDEFGTRLEKCKGWLLGLPCDRSLPTGRKVLAEARRSKAAITLRMGFGSLALFLFLVHTFVKLMMASYGCKQGSWNIPISLSSLGDHGCVDVKEV